MVILDTSIFIALYRKREHRLGQLVWYLTNRNEAALIGQVWVEYLGGFRDPQKQARHRELLSAFPWVDTDKRAYDKAACWLAKYPRLGAGDAIIAATAFCNGCDLLTLDRDFLSLQGEGLSLVDC